MPTAPHDQRPGERIAKLLARAGIASRRDVERMIAEGRVARDGAPINTPATLLASLDGVTVDGQPVQAPAPARLFLYHKPVGLLVTERDPNGRPTIYDRLPRDLPRVVPVGRLDLNTEGLLLLTTDGGFKRQLELPVTGVERSYRARAYGNVTQAQLEALIEGVEIEGVRYRSIDANLERRTGANVWIELTLTEGKNREVRRVLEHLGLKVSRLIRTRYGPFVLGDLPAGAVGEVTQQDLVAFRRALKGGAPAEPAASPVAAPPRPGFRTPARTDRSERTARAVPATTAKRPPPAGPGGHKRAAKASSSDKPPNRAARRAAQAAQAAVEKPSEATVRPARPSKPAGDRSRRPNAGPSRPARGAPPRGAR